MTGQTASVDWKNGKTPVSRRFDDPYYSILDGLAETRHVFLSGNGLPAAFTPGLHIAELGFGTGLNLLAAWQAWRQSGQPGDLRFTSFEAYPMATTDMATALAAFPELADLADSLLAHWPTENGRLSLPGLQFQLISGDARDTLPVWAGMANVWFLDGFSPAKNPELWTPQLMQQVARHTRPGGTLATYTAAGHVRRALSDAGFRVTRTPGYGRKRHMTTGIMEPPP